MKIIYYNGGLGRAIDTTGCEQLDGAMIIAESYGKPFRGTLDQMAEDVLRRIHCPLSAVIIGGIKGSDEYGDFTSQVVFQAVRGLL